MTNTKSKQETLPPGLYFIGDLTYLTLSEKDNEQYLWGEDGVLTSESGEQFAKFSIGNDGVYGDNDGFQYGVDSACIGAYPITSVAEVDTALGRGVEFFEEITVAIDEELGLVRFGEIEIELVDVALLGEPLIRPEGMSDLDWLRELAKAEDSEAQYTLYEELESDPETHKEAIKWMFAAARGGHSTAQYDAGYMRKYAEDHQQHHRDAVKWLRLSAEQGHPIAQDELGDSYDNGLGVEQDSEEAVKWFRLSAEQGYSIAQDALGQCYYDGNGVEQDYKEAVKWYRAAAEKGWELAQWSLGNCYYHGDGVEQDYEEAVKWYRLSAEQGCSLGQGSLGFCYFVISGDSDEAFKWLRPAAEEGIDYAQDILGTLYKAGDGVEQSDKDAIYWWEQAAEQGHELARLSLARCYLGLEGSPKTEKNLPKAFELILPVLSSDNEWMFDSDGLDASLLVTAANELLETRGGQNNPRSVPRLTDDADWAALVAFCYEHGLGVEKDVERAEKIRNCGLG